MTSSIDLTQINIHHSKAAASSLCGLRDRVVRQAPAKNHRGSTCTSPSSHIFLVQEPYHFKGGIKGLGKQDQIFVADSSDIPRACVLASTNINAHILPRYCDRDTVAVSTKWEDGVIVFVSLYLPGEETSPPGGVFRNLVKHCEEQQIPLVVGADANSHHALWGSTDTNARGEKLLDYLMSTDLSIVNRGNSPTFVVANRSEVIDITLANSFAEQRIQSWRVSNDESSSDHRYIRFQVTINASPAPLLRRNIRKANWGTFSRHLEEAAAGLPVHPTISSTEVDARVNRLTVALMASLEAACPIRTLQTKRRPVVWWNSELTKLRKRCKSLYRRMSSRLLRDPIAWNSYVEARSEYKNALRKSKRESWRNFCSGITSYADAVKCLGSMDKSAVKVPGQLRDPSGTCHADAPSEVVGLLLTLNFPGDNEAETPPQNFDPLPLPDGMGVMVSAARLKKAVNSFLPFKSPGLDGVYPVLLQRGLPFIIDSLRAIYISCLTIGYVPVSWQKSRVVFIPKPGKKDYGVSNSWRPIQLNSFLLKTLERLVDWHLRSPGLEKRLRENHQFAYLRGVSTDAAIHRVVAFVESSLGDGMMVMGAFADVEGAFNNVTFNAISLALLKFEVHPLLIRWINFYLRNRVVVCVLDCISKSRAVERGCPQGGVLSPLLWSLVIDGLLLLLRNSVPSLLCQGFADDTSFFQRGRALDVMAARIAEGLRVTRIWCQEVGLCLNPSKTELIIFSRNPRLHPTPMLFGGQLLEFKPTVRYLGVTLDRKLSWLPHCKSVCLRATIALAKCKRMVGRRWGLSPRVVKWAYTAIVRPLMEYCVVAWSPALVKSTYVKRLTKVQRLACLMITGAQSSTPTAALQCILGLTPIEVTLKAVATRAWHRLQCRGLWMRNPLFGGPHSHTVLCEGWASNDPTLRMPTDWVITADISCKLYSVDIKSRREWATDLSETLMDIVCYTDGSNNGYLSGSGVFIEERSSCRRTVYEKSVYLGPHASVFQSEVFAILHAIYWLLDGNYQNRHICLFVDSQSALLALEAMHTSSCLVRECHSTLNSLASSNLVRLMWIPAHSDFRGNEMADGLAKAACAANHEDFIGPLPILPIPLSLVHWSIKKWARAEHVRAWRNEPACRQTKIWLDAPLYGGLTLIRHSRIHLRWLVGLLTGHCGLRRHKFKLGLVDSPLCDCGEEEETPIHYLAKCTRFVFTRNLYLGSCILSLGMLGQATAGELLAFSYATGHLVGRE